MGLRELRNGLMGLSGQKIVQRAGVDLGLVLGQWTRADGGPRTVEVAGETRRDQVGRIGRPRTDVSELHRSWRLLMLTSPRRLCSDTKLQPIP